MNLKGQQWLLLVTNLPGPNQTLRMRIWRALKAAGAGLLRDGVYVLPKRPDSRDVFDEQAREILAVAGSVHILSFEADSADQLSALIALFDRTADYKEFITRLGAWRKKLPKYGELEARKILATITRETSVTESTDLFPGKPQEQMLTR
jgi:DNA-binding transcriptional regulator PaaX